MRTYPANDILQALQENPGLRLPELVEQTGWARETVRHHLDKLKKGGLLYFTRNMKSDARYLLWYVKEKKE